jgi:aspartate oxidase
MWRHVGIMRNKDLPPSPSLKAAASRSPLPAEFLDSASHAPRLRTFKPANARGPDGPFALGREESRGSHYRSDFPYREDDLFQKHSLIQRSKDVTFEP